MNFQSIGHDMGNPQVYFGVPTPIPMNTVPLWGTGAVLAWLQMVYHWFRQVLHSFLLNLYNYVYYYTKKTFHPLAFEAREGEPS
jgi:hypothetical protein